ncbi:PAS domain-containing protein, partial [Thiomicrorhabdus sp.]|uniref:PAS domain-containing protein n=1 Tax=Thiomicrorhabdus sp. TaxID=2039724 RepID=UPI0035692EB2
MWNRHNKQNNIKDLFTSIMISLLVWTVLFQGLYLVYKTDTQAYLDERIAKQNIAWQAATKMFQRGVEARFQSEINQPAVLELLDKAQDPKQAQQARIDLYRLLYPYYQKRLTQNDGHFQLHFHTADNKSFLRFHQPDRFGDDLSEARPTVVKANATLKPVSAYESGKIVSGLRHVFPLIYKGRHLGSVELSQKFESLRKEIALFNPQHEFTILYNRKLVEAKRFKQFSYIYSPSTISPQWLEEDPYRILPQTPLPLTQTMYDVSRIAHEDPSLNTDLERGEAFAKAYPLNHTYYVLTFTPIHDLNHQNMSYLISLGQADEITTSYQRLWSYGTIMSLIMLLFAYGLWRILSSRRQQNHYRSYLEGINNTMGEGLYVTDTRGMITTANASAQKLLGFNEKQLLGKNAHKLFHGIENPLFDRHDNCPIESATLQGKSYQGEMIFKKEDQQEILVSVSSQPMYIDNRLEGSVVSFNDITAQKALDEALHIAATAFETQEGIMITDIKGRILRVNKAFCRLTGYEQDEVIGLTPRILKSGVQDKDFYRELWQSILNNHFWQGEIWNRRKSGDIFLEWLTITAVINRQGEITQFVANFSDVTERHKAQEEIQRLAFYDPLTKLPNRRLLLDRLEHAIRYSQRSRQCGALFFIDLDNFKTLNDSKGHMIGDLLLKEVANRLTGAVRDVDTVSRIGGDEFIILMENLGDNPDKAANHAEEVALKILDMF